MDKHYICTGGCRGVSNQPGTCKTENCAHKGLELKECSCTDHKHWGAFQSKKPIEAQALNSKALALSLGITLALLAIISEFATSFPDPLREVTITSITLNGLAAGVGGLIIGAVVSWLYNTFRKY